MNKIYRPGGWGFVGLDKHEWHVSGGKLHTTNNKMELTAVIKALEFFSDHKYIKIYSDSMYVINCALGKWRRKKNTELWEQYDIASKDINLEFEWVKGHSNDKYNEIADKLAGMESNDLIWKGLTEKKE